MLSIITGLHRPTPRWSIMIMIDFGSIIRDYDMNFCGCSDCRVLGVPNGTSWCMFLHHMYWLYGRAAVLADSLMKEKIYKYTG